MEYAETNNQDPKFNKDQKVCMFQTCLAYEMFNLKPELFQAIVLFVFFGLGFEFLCSIKECD